MWWNLSICRSNGVPQVGGVGFVSCEWASLLKENSQYNDRCRTMQTEYSTSLLRRPFMVVCVARKHPFIKKKNKTQFPLLFTTEESQSYRFGTTWGWVNDDRIYFFMWTIPVKLFPSPLPFVTLTYVFLFYSFSSHLFIPNLLYTPPPALSAPHEDQTGSLDFEASWLIVFLSRHQGLSDRAAHHRSRLTEHPSSLGDQLPPPLL